MAKIGRPRIEIDLNLVKNLAGIQCTIKEISAVMSIPATTLQERQDFRLVYKNGLENGKASLRRIQYKLAEKSAGMAIFLGKNYLNQKDMPLIDQSDRRNISIIWQESDGNGKLRNKNPTPFQSVENLDRPSKV